MNRLTTDNPKTNTEAILNYAYAKGGRVRLAYADGEENIDLCEYVAHLSAKHGCELTPESIMEGSCMECDCEIGVLYVVAIQAAELRARLAKYEDAEEQGCLVVLPCKVGDAVFAVGERLIKKCDIDEVHVDKFGVEYLVSFICADDCDGCPFNSWHQDYSGEYSCHGEWGQAVIRAEDFGKTVFLSRKEAEAALEGGKREQSDL